MAEQNTLVIATRKSALAMWQAEHIKARLEALHPGLQVRLLGMTSKGDRILDVPLAKVGGKGLFVKELEQALLAREADIAVHSMKDVPMEFPEGLFLPVICEREDPTDAFVSHRFESLEALPQGATVGTSSLRRQCQLKALRPDLNIAFLRGNVNTRLKKLDDGEYDAIILASSGLKRLGFQDRIRAAIPDTVSLPAVGQGALGIEARRGDERVLALIRPLVHEETFMNVTAERAMNTHLKGGCQVPIAGYAVSREGEVHLRALVGDPDGSTILRAEGRAPVSEAANLGVQVAEALLAQGADAILARVYGDDNE